VDTAAILRRRLELLDRQLDRDQQKVLLKEAQGAAMLGSQVADQLLTLARQRHMDSQVVDQDWACRQRSILYH